MIRVLFPVPGFTKRGSKKKRDVFFFWLDVECKYVILWFLF